MTSAKFLNLGNSLFTMATQFSTIIGATIGAVLLNKLNIVMFFLFNAATFLFSFLMVALIRDDHGHPSLAGAKGRPIEKLHEAFNKQYIMIFFSSVKGSFSLFKKHKLLRYMIPGVFFTNIFFVTFNYLTPAWSQPILRKGAEGYSLMELGLATGFLIGAFMAAVLSKRVSAKYGQILAFLIEGLLMLFPVFKNLYYDVFVLLLAGIGFGMSNTFGATMIQEMIPKDYRGRAFGVFMTALGGVVPIGTFISGILAGILGLIGVFWISGIGVAIGAVILAAVFAKIPDMEKAKAVV